MAAVLRDLSRSPLAGEHEFTFITTWRGDVGSLGRLVIFAAGLVHLALWCLAPGTRVVHIHVAVRGSWYRKALCISLAQWLGCPVLLQVHVGPADMEAFWRRVGALRRRWFRRSFQRADLVTSVSTAGAAWLHDRLGLGDVRMLANAAPTAVPPSTTPAVDHGGMPSPSHLPGFQAPVLYLGGFADPAKGGEVLVAALTQLAAQGAAPQTLLAGPGVPPPALARLGEQCDLQWLGWLDEAAKHQALRQAEIFVLPSLSEGMPMALLEAMAAGRAIVASRAGAVPEVLSDGIDALLVEPGDTSGLASAISQLCQDAQRRLALGAAARQRAARLNQEQVYAPLAAAYAQLATASSRAARAMPAARTPRALLVCSGGGHLYEMMGLHTAWKDMDVTWVTPTGADVGRTLAGYRVLHAYGPTNRNLRNLMRNLRFAWRASRSERPDVILSTGAGIAVPFFMLGRLFRVRLVYVESYARVSGLSLTGRMVAPFAHHVFVQWPEAANRKRQFAGALL